jgi:hypothetical protein
MQYGWGKILKTSGKLRNLAILMKNIISRSSALFAISGK